MIVFWCLCTLFRPVVDHLSTFFLIEKLQEKKINEKL